MVPSHPGLPMHLEHLGLFIRIIELGSLAAAARAEGFSATTVSERLAALESHYGTRLLNRTTRAIHLTEAGRALYEGAPRLLAEEKELRSRIRSGVTSLAGPLRISAPLDLGRVRIVPLLDRFLAQHPAVTGDLLLSDGNLDVLAESIDIAVRFGTLRDSTLGVRRLGNDHRAVCASPDYLATHGVPKTPADLANHNCLRLRFGRHLERTWRFQTAGREETILVSGDRIANDGGLVRQWCLDGRGIALKSIWDVGDDLRAGRLVELLRDHSPQPKSLQLVFPPGRSHPRRVQEFADLLARELR